MDRFESLRIRAVILRLRLLQDQPDVLDGGRLAVVRGTQSRCGLRRHGMQSVDVLAQERDHERPPLVTQFRGGKL